MNRGARTIFARLLAEKQGGIGIMVGLSLPMVIGSIGLAFDANRGIEERIVNQRAADMAALGAAMAYMSSQNDSVLQPTAVDIGRVNGVSGATVTATVVSNYPNEGDQSVKVNVTSRVPFTLARVLGFSGTYAVGSTSYASLVSASQFAAPCFLALNGDSDDFTTNGGAVVNAPDCSVAAVGSIDHKSTGITAHDVIAGTGDISMTYGYLTADSARYAGAFDAPSWNTSYPQKLVNKGTTLVDPWASDANLISARTQLGSYSAPVALSDPDTSSHCSSPVDWSLGWNPNSNSPVYSYWTGSGYNIPAGTYCIKSLSTGGGLNINFASGSTVYITKGFANSASSFTFGNVNLYVNGGFDSGSSGVTIGNGDLWLGSGKISWKGTNHKGDGNVYMNDALSLGGGQTLVMGAGEHYFGGLSLDGGGSAIMGDGNFSARAGITVGGGSELAVGNGNIAIGTGNGGNAIKLSGSAKFLMGDGTFSANGDIDTAGGSRIAFGATNNHYINGDMKIAGSALFGRGRYTVNGSFVNGTGGTTWPYTSSLTGQTYGTTIDGVSVSGYDMAGINVTFVLADGFDLSGGAKTKLWASSSSVTGSMIADLLVDSLTDDNIDWTGGSANDFDGAIHFPNAQIKMAGGNSTGGSGKCFTLIGGRIWLTGGATAGTACQSVIDAYGGTGNSSTIRLVK